MTGGGHGGGHWSGGHGGSWHGGGHGGYWHGGHSHGGYYGGWWWGWPVAWSAAYWWGYPYWGYGYPYYGYYGYPYSYDYGYPYDGAGYGAPAYQDAPTTEVVPGPGAPQQAPAYMNYCDSAKAYYPKVTSCPEGWKFLPSR